MDKLPVLSNLEYICRLMYESFKIPIFFLDEKGDLVFELQSNTTLNPLYTSNEDVLDQLFVQDDPHQFPIFRTTKFLENFFSISLKKNGEFKGSVIVGPTIHSELSEDKLKGIISDFNISKEKNNFVHYYQSLPIMSNLKLINTSMHLYYMIYNEKLDTTAILQQNKLLEQTPIEIENADLSVSKKRQNVSFHTDPLYEKKIYQYVKEGRKEEIIKSVRILAEKARFGALSKTSHLRSLKNLAIAAITLATRSAMEGGLHPEIAYTLSDLYIQNIEGLKESNTVISLNESSLFDFAERVQNSQKQKYSKPISICQNYIFTNLYEELSLSKLADVVKMHPNYLSTLFKKEVGTSLTEYIQRTKVEEAKKLITFTNYSLSEIYTLLNFHDQTYFTKVFKKFTGITPKHFKNKHIQI